MPDCGIAATRAGSDSRRRPHERTDAARGPLATDDIRVALAYTRQVIFKGVGDHRPYPDHGLRMREWADLPPQQIRLDQLITTKGTLDLATLLDEDSTFFGDLFAHVVDWRGELYLEDGLHRALRAALQQRHVLHARVHVIRH
jgi:Arc/MetJ family transcription regulator